MRSALRSVLGPAIARFRNLLRPSAALDPQSRRRREIRIAVKATKPATLLNVAPAAQMLPPAVPGLRRVTIHRLVTDDDGNVGASAASPALPVALATMRVDLIRFDAATNARLILEPARAMLSCANAPAIIYEPATAPSSSGHPVETLWVLRDCGYELFVVDVARDAIVPRPERHGYDATVIGVKAR